MARPRTMAISFWIASAATALSLFSEKAMSQDVCSCSPSKYLFTLDLSLTCPPVNVTRNPGISATFCQISPFGDADSEIEDLVPVEVENIEILELGQAFEVLSQQNITGLSVDGDTFDYTSIIANEGNEDITKVIQLNIFAFNAAGEPIVNFFAISYSNICDEFPTLIEGESAGWVHFTKLEPPATASCPAVPESVPTESPQISDVPSTSATDPSDITTGAPTPEATTIVTTTVPPMSMDMMSMDMISASVRKSALVWRSIQYKMVELEDMLASAEPRMTLKSAKSDGDIGKVEKKAKSEKSEKSAKAVKESKEDKSDKKEKRRRLRVRPIYEAV